MTASPPSAPSQSALERLDTRAREIFRDIVETYLETGEPVGSRTLSRRGAASLSPASIRNVMADLAALGLLDAPHAMAGRRPTQAGLRFFVDSLLQLGELGGGEQRDIEERMALAAGGPEGVLAAASDLLSGLAGGAALVLTPAREEAPLRHVEVVSLPPAQTLLVLVFEDGAVENRLLQMPAASPSALQEAANFINHRLKGRTLSEVRAEARDALARERAALDAAAATVVSSGLAEWSGEDPAHGRSLIVRGRANLLQDAQALEDLERVRRLFDDLEKSQELVQLLDLAANAEAVKIFIGSENPLFSLTGSSLVVAPYMNGARKVVGALGVIGPTRLNYARVIPVVDYTARVVGKLLEARGGER